MEIPVKLFSRWVVVVPLASLTYCLYYFPSYPFFVPDSLSYSYLGPTRPLAYPLLLKVLFGIPGGVGWLVPLQLSLHFGAIAVLLLALGGLYRSAVTLAVAAAILSFDAHDVFYDIVMLTDGPFLSLATLALALAIQCLRDPRLRWAVPFAIVMGLCVWLRLAALAFMPFAGLVALGMLLRAPRRWLPAAAVVGLTAAMILAHMGLRLTLVHSFSQAEHTGVSPFATNVQFILPPDLVTPYPDLYPRIWKAVAPVQAQFNAAQGRLPKVQVIVNQGALSYIAVRDTIVMPYVESHPEQFGQAVSEVGLYSVADRILRAVSDAMFARDPLAVLGVAWLKFEVSASLGNLFPVQGFAFSEFSMSYETGGRAAATHIGKYHQDVTALFEGVRQSPMFKAEQFPETYIYFAGTYWRTPTLRLMMLVVPLAAWFAALVLVARDRLAGVAPALLPVLLVAVVPSAFLYDFIVGGVEMPLTRYYFPMKPLLLVAALAGVEGATGAILTRRAVAALWIWSRIHALQTPRRMRFFRRSFRSILSCLRNRSGASR